MPSITSFLPACPSFFKIPLAFGSSPLGHIHRLDELERLLVSEEWPIEKWSKWKSDIQRLIHQHRTHTDVLDRFLTRILAAGVQKDPSAALSFLTSVLDLETLQSLARLKASTAGQAFNNAFEWASLRAPLYPVIPERNLKDVILSEWKRCRPLVMYFIPTTLNMVLNTFRNFYKKSKTLFDASLVWDIVYKFFMIPLFLIQTFQPIFVVSAKVYVIGAATLVGLGALLASYQRWLKPVPDEIDHCINLDKQMERGAIEPKVGQIAELELVISALLTGQSVLLVGRSGEGKTTLFHHLIQLKKEGKLPQRLQQLVNFEVDCRSLTSNVSHGHSELINEIKDQAEGYEDKILFHVDEIDHLTPAAFQTFKKRFLEDQPSSLLIATASFEEFKKIKEQDGDGSFMRRMRPIIIDGQSEEQNRLLLDEFINRTALPLPITDEAIQTVLDLSLSPDYFPHLGRPAKVIKLMKEAIGRCKWVYETDFAHSELGLARQKLQQLKSRSVRHIKERPEDWQAYERLSERIRVLEEEEREQKKQVQKIKRILDQQATFRTQYFKLTHQVAAAHPPKAAPGQLPILPEGPVSEEKQKLYLLSYFYGIDAFKSVLQDELNHIKERLPVQVDAALVRRTFEEALSVEARIAQRR